MNVGQVVCLCSQVEFINHNYDFPRRSRLEKLNCSVIEMSEILEIFIVNLITVRVSIWKLRRSTNSNVFMSPDLFTPLSRDFNFGRCVKCKLTIERE